MLRLTVLADEVGVNLELLGVADGTVSADGAGVTLRLFLMAIIKVFELGEVVKAQIISNGVTI